MVLDMILYSYSKTFSINPSDAQHTPVSTMNKMLRIHEAMEMHKAEEISKATKKIGRK